MILDLFSELGSDSYTCTQIEKMVTYKLDAKQDTSDTIFVFTLKTSRIKGCEDTVYGIKPFLPNIC